MSTKKAKSEQTVNRIARIHMTSKNHERVKILAFDVAQFRNLFILFQNAYYDLYQRFIFNDSAIYSLLADRPQKKTKEQEDALAQLREEINPSPRLQELVEKLKAQKLRIRNNYVLQTMIRQILEDYQNFLRGMQAYHECPEKFRGCPRPPHPKKLRNLIQFTMEFNKSAFKVKGRTLTLKIRTSKDPDQRVKVKIKLPENISSISSVRVTYHLSDVWVDVVYQQLLANPQMLQNYRAGIDLGLENLIALVSDNPEAQSLIITGGEIKAFDHWFNKKYAHLQSQLDTLQAIIDQATDETVKAGKQREYCAIKTSLHRLSNYRQRWIESYFHRITRRLADWLYVTGHRWVYSGKPSPRASRALI
ncbi:MAG: transposase [Firmicutes bacterium]|nr:transposase [Bacillota bacterium]